MVMPSPNNKVSFIGLDKNNGCGSGTRCRGNKLAGTYWVEKVEGKSTMKVDATISWQDSKPSMFGWGIGTDHRKL